MVSPKRSAKNRVLTTLSTGATLTARQVAHRFNVLHPRSVFSKLRKAGYTIITYRNRRGNTVYSLSTATD